MNHDEVSPENPQAASTQRRVARPVPATLPAVLLADVSDSMNTRDGAQPLRRIDRLAKVLEYLLTRLSVQALICFNDLPIEVPLLRRVGLPEPAGSTALHVALEHVGTLRPKPLRLIVLSDGMPNSVELALAWGRVLRPMVIDAYYLGPDAWERGLRFMADLAAAAGAGGRSGHFDLVDPVLLGTELHRRLLTGPQGR